MITYQPTIKEIGKAMEDMWNKKEEEFAMTETLLNLPKACREPGHDATTKNFEYMRWECLICGRILESTS